MIRRLAGLALAAAAAVVVLPVPPATAAPSFSYTITAGTRGLNNWFLTDVTVQIQVSGATDTTCPSVKTFRSSSDALHCTASDGFLTVTYDLQFPIDKDKPTVTGATPDRAPNGNGWYSAPVNVAFSGTDATSGIASCTQASYNGPDNASAGVSGTCKDNAGNESSAGGFALKYDATAPSVNANPARGPDANGWYNHSVSVAFGGSDATSGVDSCTSGTYSGPDAESASVSGSCTDKAGNSGSESFSLKYDQTPPSVTAAPVRPPDQNGWYNRPISLTVNGADATSKLDSCSGASYTGPDKPGASLVGTCRDVAGNEASKPVEVKFDSTPPKLGKVTVSLRNGLATLRWTASPDTKAVTVLRLAKGTKKPVTVYRGNKRTFTDKKLKDGVRYSYTITGTDEAGNVATASTVADPRALWRPAAGKRLRTPPLLTWAPLAKADYYNVQLYFDGRKVLSEWPKATKLKLQRQWKFGGHRYTLEKGRYRWYVWPGFGARKASKYGKLLGGSAFVVT